MTRIREKLKSGLKKLDNLEIRLFGNRAASVAAVLTAGGIINTGMSIEENSTPLAILGNLLYITGLPLWSITKFGAGTWDVYERVNKHIKKYGKPDPRFLRQAMNLKLYSFNKSTFLGYCENQAVYLACRNNNCLDDFYKVRQESKNKIPNF